MLRLLLYTYHSRQAKDNICILAIKKMEKHIEKISSNLSSYFDKARIDALGKKNLFVQRSSAKLGSYEFLLMNLFDRSSSKERSLNDSCDWLEDHLGISLTKQSLDERYNTYAVSFMKNCFEELLGEVNKLALKKNKPETL